MRRIIAVAVAAVLAAACTSPTGTDRAPGYFEALRPVARDVTGAIADISRVLDEAYESAAMRTTRLTDLRAGHDLAIAADRAARLEPGSVYQADHDRYMATIEEIRSIYRGFDEAVASGDIGTAAVASVGMEIAAGLGFSGLSTEYCARVTFDMRLCDRPLDLEEYDAVLTAVFLQLATGYAPFVRPAPAALSTDEAAVYLSEIDTAAAARLDGLTAVLQSTPVPADREADHQTLLDLLEAAAVAHRSGDDHSILPALICRRAEAFGTATTAVGAVFLTDDDIDCGA